MSGKNLKKVSAMFAKLVMVGMPSNAVRGGFCGCGGWPHTGCLPGGEAPHDGVCKCGGISTEP